ncbi:MAG TPA: phosphoribosylformylglycinamidine cyclo-ligase, partial [Chitinophagaceae bacterium]|nr:phosphoribosylformylglycinamidine cyclo-ligase [Chitinophagaceae bacterium]
YIGKNKMTDTMSINGQEIAIGKLLLSPTRTYAPLMKRLLDEQFDAIKGVIHCSGGGQTKCMKYLPQPMQVIKDNLFTPPPVFELIRENSGANNKELYQVFNMGHRLEIFTDEASAQQMIATAATLGIEAKIVGRTVAADKASLVLEAQGETVTFQY